MHLLVAVGKGTGHVVVVVVVLAPRRRCTYKADSKRGGESLVVWRLLADKFPAGQPTPAAFSAGLPFCSRRRKTVQCFPFKVFYDEARRGGSSLRAKRADISTGT